MGDGTDGPTPIDVHDPDTGPRPPGGRGPPEPIGRLTIRIDRKEYPVPLDPPDACHLQQEGNPT